MPRLLITAALYAAAAPAFLAAAAAPSPEVVPLRQRDFVYTLAPPAVAPEVAARTDPRFVAARRATAARQLSGIIAAVLAVAACTLLTLKGVTPRLIRRTANRPFLALALTALITGAIPGVGSLAAAAGRFAFVAAAPAPLAVARALVCAAGWTVGTAAFALACSAARDYWPRAWWLVITSAAGVAALGASYWSSRDVAATKRASPALGERAAYLAEQYEMPSYKVTRANWGGAGVIAARAAASRRVLAVTPGAERLGRYEAEIFIATAVARAEANKRNFLVAFLLIAFMASLIAADAASVTAGRGKGTGDAEGYRRLPLFVGVFGACWLLIIPFLNTLNRDRLANIDVEVIKQTRKPLAAVALYYKEAAANNVADRPNAVLHFLADGQPSPAERAALARRLRRELAR